MRRKKGGRIWPSGSSKSTELICSVFISVDLLLFSPPGSGSLIMCIDPDPHFLVTFKQCYCFAKSRPTFYRKRIISQRKRENSRNPGQELVCNLCYLSPVLCNDKQSPGAMQAALSPTWRIKDARKGGERVGNIHQ
jgi:hypothetical protein